MSELKQWGDGRYTAEKVLGSGGMGITYLAHDARLRSNVVIKEILPSDQHNENFRRFLREARITRAAASNHTVHVNDAFLEYPSPYMVLEYLPNGTLHEKLAAARFTPEAAIGIFFQASQGVAAAHGKNIVHRDLKPINMLFSEEDVLKICDFGLASDSTSRFDNSEYGNIPTLNGQQFGTPGFMSPEQFDGICDFRSDVFSLGIVLYQMLTQRLPFPARHYSQWPPLDLSEVPNVLRGLISNCLAREPLSRPANAGELSSMCAKLMHDAPPTNSISIPTTPESSRTFRKWLKKCLPNPSEFANVGVTARVKLMSNILTSGPGTHNQLREDHESGIESRYFLIDGFPGKLHLYVYVRQPVRGEAVAAQIRQLYNRSDARAVLRLRCLGRLGDNVVHQSGDRNDTPAFVLESIE